MGLSKFGTFPCKYKVGRLAQRLAHLVYTEVVGGSNPSAPTNKTLDTLRTI